ncbi:MAG: hypothetical protein EPN48_09815 [Microbacteriaceae bacterium]|nr:MAG: hypothetical protein EPN48_09815 [Microbacteriaceae bacterium]
MQQRILGSQGLSSSAIGYGSMGISIAYGAADAVGGTAAIRRAHELGVTLFVSLDQPNHLIDVPMVKTLVHAHNPSREAIHAAVQKIIGSSEFQGTFNENVWCDTFATRL